MPGSFLLPLLLLLASAPAWACSCSTWPTAREAWEDAPVVAIGTVREVRPDPAAIYTRQTAIVEVERGFKGAKAGDSLTLHQELMTSCSTRWKGGEHRLFYLHRAEVPDAWQLGACNRTKEVRDAADDLLFLNALPHSARRTRLSGSVTLRAGPPDANGNLDSRPLPSVQVTITGQGETFTAFTNPDGVFELYDLPPGKYKVVAAVPAGLKLYYSTPIGRSNNFRTDAELVVLPAGGSAEIALTYAIPNKVSGYVRDPEGNPVKGACLALEAADGPAGRSVVIPECSDKNGYYAFEFVPAGTYLVSIGPGGRIGASAWYPGTADRAGAKPITVEDGKELQNLNIVLRGR